MNITYLLETPISPSASGPTSTLASARYRALLPGLELKAMGWNVRFLDGRALSPDIWRADADCGVVIVGKSFDARTLDAAKNAKTAGNRILVDLCDDHFAKPDIGAHFRALVSIADAVVVPTEAMAEAVLQATSAVARIVPDPVEGPSGAPRFAPMADRCTLCWFGHPTNLNTLSPLFQSLGRKLSSGGTRLAGRAIRFEIVTAFDQTIVDGLKSAARGLGGNVKLVLIPWSTQATWDALARADAIMLPSLDQAEKNVKSPNRLLEALNAGRVTVAHPLPSYQPFAQCAFIDADLWAALDRAIEDPEAALDRVAAGQRTIADHYTPRSVASKWAAVLRDLSPGDAAMIDSAERAATASAEPIRLNLGCGDKILPGYVNVDVAQSRRGHRPDVLCDIRQLTAFGENHADEVMAIHVVEHFWRWEVVEILQEWRRVLKPGGRLVLECPNLLSACQALLNDPESAARPDIAGQRSMWVFYGDPAWKDPLMCHRWAYTPQSLAQVMAEAGFSNIRQEPAQFKMREPRDMRLVGDKA